MNNSPPKKIPVVLDSSELERMLAVLDTRYPSSIRNRAIIELMGYAGFRSGEILNLKPAHIQWHKGIVEVHESKGAKDRNVPCDEGTIGWLRRWSALRNQDSPWFFHSKNLKQLAPSYLRKLVQRLAKRAGVQGKAICAHTLRHTYATELIRRGVNIRAVQELLGHSHINTTMIYLHICPVELASTIQSGILRNKD